jgi:serine/threonine protein kinase
MAAQPPEPDETGIVKEALKDEYELEKELGRGGMAVVYKARDKTLEREVAIKVLPFSLSFDAEFVERFQREARTAGKLEHPNIIPIYRVGRSGRVIYFVMKFIRGKSLSAVIESRGAMPVPEIKRMLIEAARALGYAHKHGIVHRDIKPDNIMFDELGQAIVTDFGIAKAQSGARLTGTGMSIGTPHYMSPEQARAQNLDGRSDVYSLGVVAYQCLTGHVPFDGEDSFSIGYKHIMEELPTPALETADQRELFSVIQKMMAKKPDDRFQTAEEMIAALEGAGAPVSVAEMSTMPTRAIEPMAPPAKAAPPAMASAATTPLPRASASMGRPKDAAPPAPPPSPPPAARPRPAPRPAAEKPRSKAPLLAAAGLGVVLLGLGGYYMLVLKPSQQTQLARADSVARAATTSQEAIRPATDTAKARADTAPAARDTTPARRDTTPTRRDTTPPPPRVVRQGTLALSGTLPPGAQLRIDGRNQTGNEFKLDQGRHRVAITAPGFRDFSTTVTIAPNQTRTVAVNMTPLPARDTARVATRDTTPRTGASAARCTSDPRFNMRNEGRACWDERPVPRGGLQIAMPEACGGRASPARIVVRVGADGQVMGNPTAVDAGSCRSFGQLAQSYAADLTFTPAKKGGQNVMAWTEVLIRPAPRP